MILANLLISIANLALLLSFAAVAIRTTLKTKALVAKMQLAQMTQQILNQQPAPVPAAEPT